MKTVSVGGTPLECPPKMRHAELPHTEVADGSSLESRLEVGESGAKYGRTDQCQARNSPFVLSPEQVKLGLDGALNIP